jgi:hypothetical protein
MLLAQNLSPLKGLGKRGQIGIFWDIPEKSLLNGKIG